MKLLTSLCLLLLVNFAFSQKPMYDICPLKNSEEVPTAKVYTPQGEAIDLKEYIGKRNVVLVFYRGGWCPYCMRHLSALQEAKSEIEELGMELIAITPDNFNRLDSSIQKGGEIDYQLLSDKDVNAINAFGIGWKVSDELYTKYKDKYGMDTEWWSGTKHHILPVPAVFIIKEGKISYQHVNPDYSKRLSTEVLLSMLNSL